MFGKWTAWESGQRLEMAERARISVYGEREAESLIENWDVLGGSQINMGYESFSIDWWWKASQSSPFLLKDLKIIIHAH